MWRITRRLRGQFSESEENRGEDACFYVVRAVLYLYKLDFTAKLFFQNITHSLTYIPSIPPSTRLLNTFPRVIFPDALFPVSSSYTVSLIPHDLLLTWHRLPFPNYHSCCKSPALSGFQHPHLRGVEGARKIGGIPMAWQTVIGARRGVDDWPGGVEKRGKRGSEHCVITFGNGVRVLRRCVKG